MNKNFADSDKFAAQHSQYEFPYHYLPTYDGKNFHIAKTRLIGFEYLSYLNYAIDKLTNINSFLDIGTGDGRMVYEVKKRFPNSYLRGIDLSSKGVAFGRAFLSEEEIVEGDITNTNAFNGQKFSHATCIEVIEHIPPELLLSFVEGIAFHLNTKAELVVTVPSDNVPVSRKHFQHFNEKSIKYLLEPYFDILEFKYINQNTIRVNWIKKILVNDFFILNHRALLNYIYNYYKKYLFLGNQKNTRRLFIHCRKKS